MRKLNEIFLQIADKVSYGMGTPTNIIIWLVAVVVWIACGPLIAASNFLPVWFTSNNFNFPLNTVTTLAELYIGFLVAAATNRAQKALETLIKNIFTLVRDNKKITEKIEHMMKQQDDMLALIEADEKMELEELRKQSEILLKENEILKREVATYNEVKKKGQEIISKYE